MKKSTKALSLILTLVLFICATAVPTFADRYVTTNTSAVEGAMPSKGTANVLVLYTSIKGESKNISYSASNIEELFFGSGTNSVSSWYKRSSYGALTITGDVVEYTTMNTSDSYTCMQDILDEIIINNTDINWNEYDANDDGYIDGIHFIMATDNDMDYKNRAYTSTTSKKVGDLTISKVAVYNYPYVSYRTFLHETGHMLGAIDIYSDNYNNPNGSKTSCIMDTGFNDHLAVMKYTFGWAEPIKVNSNTTITLPSISNEGTFAIVYPDGDTNSNYWFTVEYLTKSNNNDVEGVRITRVVSNLDTEDNIKLSTLGAPFTNKTFSYVECISPNSSEYLLKAGGQITPTTTPNTNYYTQFTTSGTSRIATNSLVSNLYITVLSNDANEAKIKIAYGQAEETTTEESTTEEPTTEEATTQEPTTEEPATKDSSQSSTSSFAKTLARFFSKISSFFKKLFK